MTETNETTPETSTSPEDNDETTETTETPEASNATYESQLLMSMMADKEIQKVLNAKREGKEVSVSLVDEEAPEGHEPVSEELMENLDPEIKEVLTAIDKKISPLFEKIGALEQMAANQQRENVDTQIGAAQEKHSDFNKYRKEMATIAREIPNLGLEELYLIAKNRAGDLDLSAPSTHSELPTPTPRSKLNKDTKDSSNRRGRRGFQHTLADALAKIEFNR